MGRHQNFLVSTITALACCSFSGLAHSDDIANAWASMFHATPLSDADLDVQHARGVGETVNIDQLNVQLNDLRESAKLEHNYVYSSNTGNNTVSHDAFSGSSGFATVIQNSGNNVIIQNATIINFAVHN